MGKILERVKKVRVTFSYLLVILLILSSLNLISEFSINSHAEGNSSILSYTFYFEEPLLNDVNFNNKTFTKVYMPNCLSHAVPGDPSLPIYPVKILLPQGKDISNIDVSYQNFIEMDCDLSDKPIVPQQKAISISLDVENITFVMNDVIYNSTAPVFDMVYSDVDIGYCRGYSLLSLALKPVQYIPGGGKVFYCPEMTINIKVEENNNVNQFFRNNLDDEEWVEKLAYNPKATGGYDIGDLPIIGYTDGLCDSGDNYDYVIITTTQNGLDHWETSPTTPYNWTSLINKHETDDGLSCTLVTVEDIIACPDYWNDTALYNDTPARIREFCKDAYQDWGTSYIFIGGDDEWIPAREMDYTYESDVDSDIYWNHLDKTFNADADTDWGEEGDGGFDLYAEMYIGRITCDVPQDVSNWMKKSFYYANSSDAGYLDNAAFYGGDTTWSCEGDDFIDYSAIKGTDNWLGPNPGAHGSYPSWLGFQYGFETWNSVNPDRQFNLSVKWTAEPTNPGWQGGTANAAITGLKNAINNDQVTLISGIAHADELTSLDVSSSSWESDYHNTKPFFIHDYGCHNGDMDADDDGVLHSMLFHSDTELAFGCVYNTGYGWGSATDTNSSSALQQKLFWDYLFDTENNSGSVQNWQLGKAMAWSKDSMAPTINWTYGGAPGSWRGVVQGCLLFGDPAQKIRLVNNPPQFSNQNPSNGSTNVDILTSQLSISITDSNSNLLNWTIETNPNIGSQDNSSSSEIGGTKTCNISGLNYSNVYTWFVNATDGTDWANSSYTFTTRAIHTVSSPSSFEAAVYNKTQINLTWLKDSNATTTYIERDSSANWSRGEGTLIYNDTGASVSDTGLTSNTSYYYQAWSWDSADSIWSATNASDSNATVLNSAPVLSSEIPVNGSTDQSRNPTLSITISDLDNELMNVSFWTTSTGSWTLIDYNSSSSDGTYIQTNSLFGSYSTEYWWSVNCTDGYSWTNATYHFTTEEQSGGNNNPTSTPNIGGGGNSPPDTPVITGSTEGYVDENYDFTANAEDSNGNTIKYRFDWGDDSLSGWTEFVSSGASASMSHSWNLPSNYSVKVIAQDDKGENSSWSSALSIAISAVETVEEPTILDNTEEYNTSANEMITFNASKFLDTNETIVSYLWDFGDETIGMGMQANHAYSLPGTYLVTLTIYYENGKSKTITFEVIVQPEGNVAQLDEVEDEQSEEGDLFPLFLAFIAGFFGILFVLFWKKIKSTLSKRDDAEPHHTNIEKMKEIKDRTQQIYEYSIEPKKPKFDMINENYDHDIVQSTYNKSIKQSFELDQITTEEKNSDLEYIREYIDKFIIATDESDKEK